MKKYAVFVGMGFELLAITLVTIWVGQKIEEKYPFDGLWPVFAVIFGLAGWFYRVIILLKKLSS